jgi:hypothetical protein
MVLLPGGAIEYTVKDDGSRDGIMVRKIQLPKKIEADLPGSVPLPNMPDQYAQRCSFRPIKGPDLLSRPLRRPSPLSVNTAS